MKISLKLVTLTPAAIGLIAVSAGQTASRCRPLVGSLPDVAVLGTAQVSDIATVQSILQIDSSGHLTVDAQRLEREHLAPSAQTLLRYSLTSTNAMIDTGMYRLKSDGILHEVALRPEARANGDWFTLHWWGYDAGVSHGNVAKIGNLLRGGVGPVRAFLQSLKWAGDIAAATAPYLLVYYGWMWTVDYLGGNRGVTLTATWPNVYMPVVWYQS